MKQKYIDEKLGLVFEFGTYDSGNVDLALKAFNSRDNGTYIENVSKANSKSIQEHIDLLMDVIYMINDLAPDIVSKVINDLKL